jgi:hypothetical protein
MSGVWYVTRERVMTALDIQLTAQMNEQVDTAIESASRMVEKLTHRKFYPEIDTRYFRWPDANQRLWFRLWLEADELISLTSLSSGGVVVPPANVFLEPANVGPPFTFIELDQNTASVFGGGSTAQRDVTLTGVFGHSADSKPAGNTTAVLNGSQTDVAISNSARVGVGDILLIDTERVIVTEKLMVSSGLTIDATDSLAASTSDTSIKLSAMTAIPQAGEQILIDAELMLVSFVAGDTLVVKRAQQGTVLATHAALATVYVPRTLTVTRGVLGTTAGGHVNPSSVTRHVPPGPVSALTLALALNQVLQEVSGYSRTVGSGDNERNASGAALTKLTNQVVTSFGRRARMRSV